jgi:hypothetical protein
MVIRENFRENFKTTDVPFLMRKLNGITTPAIIGFRPGPNIHSAWV